MCSYPAPPQSSQPTLVSTPLTPTAFEQPVAGDENDLDYSAIDLDGDSDLSSGEESGEGSDPPSEGEDSDDDEGGRRGGGPLPPGSPNDGHGRGPGDPPGGDDGLADMLSPDQPGGPDLLWTVDESEVYKDKDLMSVNCPEIPQDAAADAAALVTQVVALLT